jgi:hypothetical protein
VETIEHPNQWYDLSMYGVSKRRDGKIGQHEGNEGREGHEGLDDDKMDMVDTNR